MLTIFSGPLAFILYPLFAVLVGVLLHRQGWSLLGSIAGAIFSEIGLFVFLVTWAVTGSAKAKPKGEPA